MNKKLLIGAFIAFDTVVVLGVIAIVLQPDVMHVERSVVVQATPADVFPLANDYREWGKWDPWRAKDPDQKTTISDPPVGVGAWTAWEGDENVGKGKMTITESVENVRVVQDLEFFEPWQSKAVATVALTPEGAGTKVTWSFDSQNDFMGKAMGLVMDMEAMLAPDFEKGLVSLKAHGEAAATARLAAEADRQRLADEAAAAAAASAGGLDLEGGGPGDEAADAAGGR